MKSTFASFLLTGLMLILFAGCVKKPIEGRMDPYQPAQIHFASKDLRNHTAVGVPIVTRDEAGSILHVTVPIRAATNLQLYVDYRVTFFDRNGQSLGTIGWLTKTLPPNTPDQIQVNSMSPRAADFQIDFRYAK